MPSKPPDQSCPAIPERRAQFYRRRLPHWQPDGAILFVTFRLFGSLPAEAVARLADEAEALSREPASDGETPRDLALRTRMRLFELIDGALDAGARSRPDAAWMSDPRLATMVRDAIRYWDGHRYLAHRYVVMPNHVHLLIEPLPVIEQSPCTEDYGEARWPLAKIMQGLKGYTAREGNRLLRRSGTFWQDESRDHWIRDDRAYASVVEYVDLNPVVAGLCRRPEEWPWCSAAEVAELGDSGE